jgi:bacteriocin-like protein
MVIASIEWERVMTTNNHEMTETELEQVTGGKPSAAPKQGAFPTETIKFSYGALQWDYTKQ